MPRSDDPGEMLQRELERLFHDLVYQRHPSTHFTETVWEPPTDVMLSPKGATVLLELAGVPRENVRVRLFNRTLEITGHRARSVETEGTRYHRAEIYFGDFRRVIELPWTVDIDVRARFRDGLLEIRLRRAAVAATAGVPIEERRP
jgi:HSP20 family protein